MSFIVPPVGDLASVVEMARFRRGRRLPAEVVEQIHAAAQLADELEAAGVQLRFTAPDEHGGRVRAVLVDGDGDRPVSLTEVVELDLPF